MSEHAEHENHDAAYIKVWGLLMILLFVSIVGPMAEIQWLTLVTAFGVACVKAYYVATRFMHINLEAKFVTYMVVTCLVFMLLFFAGTAPDVMKEDGANWEKPAWIAANAQAGEKTGHGGEHH